MTVTERITYERHINEVFSEAKKIALLMNKRRSYEELDATWRYLCQSLNREYKDL